MLDENNIEDLIVKKLSGNASADELKALDRWLEKSDQNRSDYANMEQIWTEVPNDEELLDIDAEKAWERQKKRQESDLRANKGFFYLSPTVRKYAALIVVLIGVLSVVIFLTRSGESSKDQLSKGNDGSHLNDSDSSGTGNDKAILYTATEEPKEIYLKDGSFIYLDENSKAKYVNGINQKTIVNLSGEGYFNVRPQKKGFTVRGNYIYVDVLGTVFGIKEDLKKNRVELSVLEGKIKVYSKNNRRNVIEIEAGEFYHYDIEKEKFTKKRGKGFFQKFKKLRKKINALLHREK